MGACARAGVLVVLSVALIVGCAARKPIEQRDDPGSHGAAAVGVADDRLSSGERPTSTSAATSTTSWSCASARYLREHPEDAHALGVSAFRFDRQVSWA